MTISEQYHFNDFTRQNYRNLLRLAKQRFVFRFFTDFDKTEPFVLWRHDVDFSMHSARALAKIEAEEGVKATYFLHLHNEFYNLLEAEVTECVKDIIGLGHTIGLHFDSHFYKISEESQLDRFLLFEKSILERVFDTEIGVFSFHNTNDFTMSCQKWQYGGMINTYAEYFQKEVTYCSDSNGYWRFRRLQEVLEDGSVERLHVLTHDAWWQEESMSPRKKISRCIEGRALKNNNFYDGIILKMGRLNIDE